MRPGEKLYEELLIGDNPTPTAHPRIMKAHESYLDWPELEKHLETLGLAAKASDVTLIKAVLQACVQGYEPCSSGTLSPRDGDGIRHNSTIEQLTDSP